MALKIFFCYAHEDEELLNKLKMHLKPLHRQGLIDMWHDRDISAGTEWEHEISQHLNTANIILLLVSPDFMDSEYCYGIEMQRAIERHEREEARVIPIILRPVYWQGVPLGKLQALPTDAKPVTDPDWHNLDRALFNVTEGIRKVIDESISKLTDNSSTKGNEQAEDFPKASSTISSITPAKPQNLNPTNLDKNIISPAIKSSKSDATHTKLPNSEKTVGSFEIEDITNDFKYDLPMNTMPSPQSGGDEEDYEVDSLVEDYYTARSLRGQDKTAMYDSEIEDLSDEDDLRPDPRRTRQLIRKNILASKSKSALVDDTDDLLLDPLPNQRVRVPSSNVIPRRATRELPAIDEDDLLLDPLPNQRVRVPSSNVIPRRAIGQSIGWAWLSVFFICLILGFLIPDTLAWVKYTLIGFSFLTMFIIIIKALFKRT